MPVAIVISDMAVPAILHHETDDGLLAKLQSLKGVPNKVVTDAKSAREWLKNQPAPSGWFASANEAEAYTRQTGIERDGQLLRAAMKALGQNGEPLSQAAMAAVIGLTDSAGDGSPIRKILSGKNGLSGPSRRALAYALKHGALSFEDEERILDRLDGGRWATVAPKKIRRVPMVAH